MGNEQSGGTSTSTTTPSSSSTFSFLSGRASVKKPKGIVVVRDGVEKVETIDDDEIYKRFQEIPRFLPILPHAIGRKEQPGDNLHRMSSRPIYKFATCLQEHLKVCAKSVTSDQAQLTTIVKSVDNSSSALTNHLNEKKKSYDRLVEGLSGLKSLVDEVARIQALLEEIVPIAETLNELLPPTKRQPPLPVELGRILERTPESSSTESSLHSTPRKAQHNSPRHIRAIEEVRVVDKP